MWNCKHWKYIIMSMKNSCLKPAYLPKNWNHARAIWIVSSELPIHKYQRSMVKRSMFDFDLIQFVCHIFWFDATHFTACMGPTHEIHLVVSRPKKLSAENGQNTDDKFIRVNAISIIRYWSTHMIAILSVGNVFAYIIMRWYVWYTLSKIRPNSILSTWDSIDWHFQFQLHTSRSYISTAYSKLFHSINKH